MELILLLRSGLSVYVGALAPYGYGLPRRGQAVIGESSSLCKGRVGGILNVINYLMLNKQEWSAAPQFRPLLAAAAQYASHSPRPVVGQWPALEACLTSSFNYM